VAFPFLQVGLNTFNLTLTQRNLKTV